ncbi:retrovirus-related pol polyprotein from transposon TNT 1-94 [Tanacetum coccineum]
MHTQPTLKSNTGSQRQEFTLNSTNLIRSKKLPDQTLELALEEEENSGGVAFSRRISSSLSASRIVALLASILYEVKSSHSKEVCYSNRNQAVRNTNVLKLIMMLVFLDYLERHECLELRRLEDCTTHPILVDSAHKAHAGNLSFLCNFVENFMLKQLHQSICLLAKASPTQAWLWHRRLSHLNFDYITLLSKKDVVTGLPKLKYVRDQLCSSCEMSKAKRSSFKTKAVPSSKGRLNLLHMDLCGPMRVASINGKKYILRHGFLKQDTHAFYKEEGHVHQTSVSNTLNERSMSKDENTYSGEAARPMLQLSKLPLSI